MGAKEVLENAVTLPAEQRAEIVDHLLGTLIGSDPELEEAWNDEAERRLNELVGGQVIPVPGEVVFGKVRELYRR